VYWTNELSSLTLHWGESEIYLAAQTAEAVRYTVRFPEPQTHYAVVEAVLPTDGQAQIEVFMPVWTPGSYLVREYARHMEGVTATTGCGANLVFAKSTTNRWQIQTGGAREVHFNYRVYCREMSVRTNWVEDSFALLNGAPTFVTLAGGLQRPHDVQLVLPAAWQTTMTGLAGAPDGVPHHYLAPDYDTLVDSPILAGNPVVHQFDVDGLPHFLVNHGEESKWDGKRAAADFAKIVQRYRQMWGSLPYGKYVFLNLITEGSGGLEHSNSVCVITNRWSTSTRKAYLSWLGLASHEYFHVWNVKRLRPVELGPFDYEQENHTKSLWVAEGLTDYYAPLMLHRAGLSSEEEYLSGLSMAINRLQTTPGRLVQSAEEASFDAWIKLYRPDENSPNTTISYYTKGAVVGWLLDAKIRKSTGGRKSLDDLMGLAFSRYSGANGYTPEQFKAVAEEVAETPLKEFFQQAVESTEELGYTEALDLFGLRFKQPSNGTEKAWLGADTRIDNGRLIVAKLLRGTPAYAAGMDVDDEIVAIDDYRVRADQLSKRLESYRPGDKVSMTVARREKLIRIELTLGEEPQKKWELEVLPDASAEQKRNFNEWLNDK
jgi:predicted metalloprotease with PDZ domain